MYVDDMCAIVGLFSFYTEACDESVSLFSAPVLTLFVV